MKKLLLSLFLLPSLVAADTLVPTQAALDAKAATTLSNVDLAASLFDVAGAEDYVNAQPFCQKKITTAGATGSAPLNIVLLGDSMLTNFVPGVRMFVQGRIGDGLASTSGTITSNTSTFSDWITGVSYTMASGSTAQLRCGEATVIDRQGDRAVVVYLKQSGGGTFDLEYQANGTGGWTSLGTIDTANATTIGAVSTFNLPTSNEPAFRLRVNNVTGAGFKLLGGGIFRSDGKGVTWNMLGYAGGIDFTDMNTTPAAIFTPIWTAFAPDLVVVSVADAVTAWQSGGSFPTLYAAANTIKADTDWILKSAWPIYFDGNVEATQPAIRAAQRAWAVTTGHSFVNSAAAIRTYALGNARGLYGDTQHLTGNGAKFVANQFWSRVPLGLIHLGQTLADSELGNPYIVYNKGRLEFRSSVYIIPTGDGQVRIIDPATPLNRATGFRMDFSGAEPRLWNGGTISAILGAGVNQGLHPFSDGFLLGQSSRRWRLAATGIQAATNALTTTTTLGSDHHTVLCDASSGAFDVDLPAAASHPGRVYVIKNVGASNAPSIDPNSTELLDGSSSSVTLSTQWQSRTIQSNGTSWFTIGSYTP
ncbi:hypothetical protein OKA05_02085 [Luteolibacter arcticus]|uniref:Uncharacterized protein n=1 Tax=Luteolibacter arcticus TaxID=1581411 RepID=A0ABT3GCI6_9BACT|nr:hypothetical protein [Luteolibacter arcticus]MCW1921322.1 hypothetical protein [Luteolibacter arcticus]